MAHQSPPVLALLREYRRDDEPPPAIAKQGWRYHPIGIPTNVPCPGEQLMAHCKMHVSGFNTNLYAVERMRFEPDCPLPELIKTVPHIAFEVDDLVIALQSHEVIYPADFPSQGVCSAMIVHDGAPVERIAFCRKTPEDNA